MTKEERIIENAIKVVCAYVSNPSQVLADPNIIQNNAISFAQEIDDEIMDQEDITAWREDSWLEHRPNFRKTIILRENSDPQRWGYLIIPEKGGLHAVTGYLTEEDATNAALKCLEKWDQ